MYKFQGVEKRSYIKKIEEIQYNAIQSRVECNSTAYDTVQ